MLFLCFATVSCATETYKPFQNGFLGDQNCTTPQAIQYRNDLLQQASQSRIGHYHWKKVDWEQEGQIFFSSFEEAVIQSKEQEEVFEFQVADSTMNVYMNLPHDHALFKLQRQELKMRTDFLRLYQKLMKYFVKTKCPEEFKIFQQLKTLEHSCNLKMPFLCVLNKDKTKAMPLNFRTNLLHYRNDIYNPFFDTIGQKYMSFERYMGRLLMHYYSHAIIGVDFITASTVRLHPQTNAHSYQFVPTEDTPKLYATSFFILQVIYVYIKNLLQRWPDLESTGLFFCFVEVGPGNGNNIRGLLNLMELNAQFLFWNPYVLDVLKRSTVFCLNDMAEGSLKTLQKFQTEEFLDKGFNIQHNVPVERIQESITIAKRQGKKTAFFEYHHEIEDAMPHRAFWVNEIGQFEEIGVKQGHLCTQRIDFRPTEENVPPKSIYIDSPVGQMCTRNIMHVAKTADAAAVLFVDYYNMGPPYYKAEGPESISKIVRHAISRERFSLDKDMHDITLNPNIKEYEKIIDEAGFNYYVLNSPDMCHCFDSFSNDTNAFIALLADRHAGLVRHVMRQRKITIPCCQTNST